jgi:chaperone required for assembly of F1-ATPase
MNLSFIYSCFERAIDIQILDKLCVDEILEIRKLTRQNKNWKLSDEIRNYLDDKLIFIFDSNDFQDVYYLNDKYFHVIDKIEKIHNIKFSSKRKFVEWNIKRDIKSEDNFEAWLYTNLSKSVNYEKKR